MKYVLISSLLLFSIFVSGCAFSDAKLDVKYKETFATPGPLASIEPVKIEVQKLQDNRPFLNKIGDKKNGFGRNCADIATTSPVSDIIRDGIVVMLKKNGHMVTDDKVDIIVSGVVERFWFESQMNLLTIEFMGTADLNLEFKDALTGKILLSKRYSGYHNEELLSGYHKEMQSAMNNTLKNLIDDISMDPQLVDVMRSYSNNQASAL